MPANANATDVDHLDRLLVPDKSLMERVTSVHPQWQGRIFSVEKLDVCLPDGSMAQREVVRHHGGCGVLALRGTLMCLVRQWRVAANAMSLEIPAGKLEAGEDPRSCAARELSEETGLVADSLELLCISAGSPGFTDEKTYIFWVQGLGRHPAHPDNDEFVDACWLEVDEVLAAIREGRITDAKTIIAALYASAALSKKLPNHREEYGYDQ